jgi:RNA polymerase sigma factor FliA
LELHLLPTVHAPRTKPVLACLTMGGTETQRNELVIAHLDLARKAAAMIFPRVKGHVEFAELEAMGSRGLVEAAQRFDPSRGTPFAGFAWHRVFGAIMDELRRGTTLPKARWTQLQALRASADYLEHRSLAEQGATAKRAAATTTVSDTLAKVQAAIAAIKTVYLTSLDAAKEHGFEPASSDGDGAAELLATQEQSNLKKIIAGLPAKESALLTKHYYENKTLETAGTELGVSKSWASRIHAQAIERMRKKLQES